MNMNIHTTHEGLEAQMVLLVADRASVVIYIVTVVLIRNPPYTIIIFTTSHVTSWLL